jgi:hypothetical protein
MMNPTKRSKCGEKKHDASHYAVHGTLTVELIKWLRKNTIGNERVGSDFNLFTASIGDLGKISYSVERDEKLEYNLHRRCVSILIDWDGDNPQISCIVELQRIIESNPNFGIVRTNAARLGKYATIWVGGPIRVPSLLDLCFDVASKNLDATECYTQLPADLQHKCFRCEIKWNVDD